MSEHTDPDTLDSILKRAQERAADRLDRRMQEAGAIKSQEEAASQRRLDEMWRRDQERQRQIAAMQAEKDRQERLLVRYVFISVAVIILVVIALAVVIPQL